MLETTYTQLGKITVLKSLVASQLTYIFSPLHANNKVIKETNGLFCNFLCNDKGDKIKRNVMINDYPEGGLKMIDIDSFNKSLKGCNAVLGANHKSSRSYMLKTVYYKCIFYST